MSKFKIYFKAILIPVLVGGIVGFLISGSMDYNSCNFNHYYDS